MKRFLASFEKSSMQILEAIPAKILHLGIRILLVFLLFFIGTKVIKLIRKILRKSMEKAQAETGVIQFVESFVKAALYVLLVFLLASQLGVDATSIVALLGSAGVAIGLAIQGSLSNLAGGVLILLLKPFKVGDYIIESVSNHEGFVTEIQIFYTKLRTADNRIVVLPNGVLANNSLVNVTSEKDRRLDIKVGVSYDTDLKKAKEVLLNVLKQEESLISDKDCLVFVDELADSSVNIGLRCYVESGEYWNARWRIIENCKYALDDAGISIPFPQMDVHLQN